jgi:peptide deformylase
MSILKIARMGHPVLLQPAAPLVAEDIAGDAGLQGFIDDMIETLADAGGVGLAAPQVYAGRRIILAMAPSDRDEDGDSAPLTILINPELELSNDEKQLGWEGCLSIPGLRGAVPRAPVLRYHGFGRDGLPIEGEAQGFFARVLQHEVDHLDGVLYPMRMKDFRYFGFDEELNRLEEEARAAAASAGDTE